MDLKLGERIILKNDYIAQFTREEHDSKSFQVVAVTDVAIAVKNMRSNRTYTLPTAKLQENVEPFIPMKKGSGESELIPDPGPSDDTDTDPTPPAEVFTHTAPIPTGGIVMTPVTVVGTVVAGDDPFGDLYT